MNNAGSKIKISSDNRAINLSILCLIAIFGLGLYLAGLIVFCGLNSTNLYSNSFHYLFVEMEPVIFIILALGLLFVRRYILLDNLCCNRLSLSWESWQAGFRLILLLALGVFCLTWLGDIIVLHRFPLSNDEYIPRFQAQIFLSGKIKAVIDSKWAEFAQALTPSMVIFDPSQHTWTSGYLPVYAMIRTIFLALGAESCTNPFLAAGSIILIALLSRLIWPEDKFAPVLAAILLISSTQFLITSMTSYSMPAHLCLNLGWLYFYCRHDKLGTWVTPWIGFFALGLHNPFVHALFVSPFLLTILKERKWRRIFYFFGIYLLACIVWYLWWRLCRPSMAQGEDFRIFLLPGLYQALIQPMNLSLFFPWQSMAVSLLFILALWQRHSLSQFFRNLLWGCILTFVFYFLFPWDQILGWGYRFLYGVLGNFILLAVAGWHYFIKVLGQKKGYVFILLSTVLALLVQFPLRAFQVERFVRPFAGSMQYLQSLPQSFVVVDPASIWLSLLLVRNDPFLRNSPKILFTEYLNEGKQERLRQLGEVHFLEPNELDRYGMHPVIKQKRGSDRK